jgi:hypothetical protein
MTANGAERKTRFESAASGFCPEADLHQGNQDRLSRAEIRPAITLSAQASRLAGAFRPSAFAGFQHNEQRGSPEQPALASRT